MNATTHGTHEADLSPFEGEPLSFGSGTSSSKMSLKTAITTLPAGIDTRDVKALLEMCDSVRVSLTTSNSLGSHVEQLIKFLRSVLADEVHETAAVLAYDVILEARLDRLIEALLDPLNKPPEPIDSHCVAVAAASTLQKQWKARFKEKYCEMEETRNRTVLTTGRLRGVSFVAGPVGDRIPRWEVNLGEEPPEPEVAKQLEPGQ